MAKVKYTKNALREEEKKLSQLEAYLPTIQLKKKLLQFEINSTKILIEKLLKELKEKKNFIESFFHLIDENIMKKCEIKHVEKRYQNIAGIEIPSFQDVIFVKSEYLLFETDIWSEKVIFYVKEIIKIKQHILVEEEKKMALLKELKEVSIRVNLFEKILIPRAFLNIKKIKIFLQDQELAFISRAKIAKNKILLRKIS